MILNPEERIVYWGAKHYNIACRDLNDDSEIDLTGLERILYSADFLAITDLFGVSPYDDSVPFSDIVFEDEQKSPEASDYEKADSALNPFEYAFDDEELPLAQFYSSDNGEAPVRLEDEIQDQADSSAETAEEDAPEEKTDSAKSKSKDESASKHALNKNKPEGENLLKQPPIPVSHENTVHKS